MKTVVYSMMAVFLLAVACNKKGVDAEAEKILKREEFDLFFTAKQNYHNSINKVFALPYKAKVFEFEGFFVDVDFPTKPEDYITINLTIFDKKFSFKNTLHPWDDWTVLYPNLAPPEPKYRYDYYGVITQHGVKTLPADSIVSSINFFKIGENYGRLKSTASYHLYIDNMNIPTIDVDLYIKCEVMTDGTREFPE